MLYDAVIRGALFKKLYQRDKAVVPNVAGEARLILDLGCGTGFATRELAKIGAVIGVDREIRFLKAARASEAVKAEAFIRGDTMHLPFPPETFDFVCMYDLLHHVKDQEKALQEARGVLKRRGHLFVKDVKKCKVKEYYLNVIADLFELFLYRCPRGRYPLEGEWKGLLEGFESACFSSSKNEIFFVGEKP